MAKTVLEWTLKANDQASREFEHVGRSADRMSGMVKAGAFAAGAALAATALAAVKFSADSIKAYAEAETAQVRLNFAFEKFPALAGGNVDALRKLNTELQKTTRFEDDAIAAAQGTLAQYDLNAQQLTELTPLLLDYAAVTGRDVGSAAEDLGKALLGQGRALKAVGIDFQDAGTPAANYAQLIAGLSEKVQGFATKDADTISGRLETLNNQFGDIQEKVGQAFVPGLELASDVVEGTLLPSLDRLADSLGPKIEESMALLGPKLADAITAATPLVEGAVSGLIDAIPSLLPTENDLSPTGFFGAFGPDGQFARMAELAEAKNGLQDFVSFWDLAFDGMADTVDNKSWYIKSVWASTATAMKQSLVEQNMYQAGYDFVAGAALGIGDASYLAEVQAENMALRTADKVRNTWQIKSPSKLAERYGSYFSQGAAGGIEKDAWRVSAAAARMLDLGSVPSIPAVGFGLTSAVRPPAVGVGGLGMSGGVTVNVRVDGNVLGTDASIGRAVTTGVVNAIRQGQVNPVEFTRALGI